MAYLFVPFPMTLDDLKGHSCNAGLIKCNLTNICAIFHMVSTNTARRAVSRQYLSFLSHIAKQCVHYMNARCGVFQVDPALIGGMVVTVGDKYIDMSTATKIKTYTNLISQAA